jgi:hypothetical protein
MNLTAVREAILGKALSDPIFAKKLRTDPEGTLTEYGWAADKDLCAAISGVDEATFSAVENNSGSGGTS